MVIRQDVAEVLIGTWLQGEHLDDAKLINVNEFGDYADMAKVIKAGTHDPIEVAKLTKRKAAEVGGLISYGLSNLYESAMLNIKQEKMTEELSEACGKRKKAKDIKEIIKKYDITTVETVKEAKNMAVGYIEELDRRKARDVVLTGISTLDDILFGIRPKELTSIGARPSVGKSAFMLQVAVNVAKNGKKVLYFPLEMTVQQTVERIISRYLHKADSRSLRLGKLDGEQWAEVQMQLDRVEALEQSGNFQVYEGCGHLEQIIALIEKEQPYMVVIDQLQQMKTAKQTFNDVRSRFSYMTAELQGVAMSHDCAVWLACQVNRTANQNTNNEPTLENLKESGSIEEDSDNVILLHRDEKEEEEQCVNGFRIIQCNVAKQRSGPTAKIKLKFMPERFAFYPQDNTPSGFGQMRTDDIEF